ncbi:chitin deacetylase [Coprinopsis cinerea okayama7|uniref:chitin deacetylase n=1 Tax=Coprinopsis cinerea (strain Okayama-7 / 130 / ATCC MYA-4618 / FGSC 9003) TaxID=240176 RepID=A8NXH5_COPC7|nr:chitin deacetylase [Coprinopsis cinerea okayama7\|eukprot:XP_001837170.1 chitin deacetylase [Coprinopsis cinerea okayama7\
MLLSTLFAFLPLVSAVTVPALNDRHDSHEHVQPGALPERWYQDDSHPVHRLFKRATDDGIAYPPVGSPEWSAPFPQGVPDPAFLPQDWVDALNAAVEAGRIPDIPLAVSERPQTNPVYPATVNPTSPEVCSTTYKCRGPEDLWDAPDGVFASSFDDGPYPSSGRLVEFLSANNVKTTHFMIGVHILANPSEFVAAFEADNDIAVHTWSHPYMTTLSNLDILGQLGWTMQLIHHSTGGRVPRYWRPPYGDSDNRVRAIAKEVFGLETVIWNLDTDDWGLSTGAVTPESIVERFEGWLSGPKSPGLMILQHEVTDASIDVFMNVFPLIAQQGWEFGSLASVVGDRRAYQNAESSSSDDVFFKDIIVDPAALTPSDDTGDSDYPAPTSDGLSEPTEGLSVPFPFEFVRF